MLITGYYAFPIFILLLSTAALVHFQLTLRRQRARLTALVSHSRLMPVVNSGWIRAVLSHLLVPGDVVVLRPGKAPCDMVLLTGACLCEESMLSGEVRPALLLPCLLVLKSL